jgi:CHAT domain-containing protein
MADPRIRRLADILVRQPGLLDERAIADFLATTLQQAETWQDVRSQAYALGYLGQLYQQQQQWDAAIRLTRRALRLSQSINADAVTYRWQWQLGQLLAAQGQTDEAIQTYQQTLQTLATLRSDLAAVNPEVRFSFREEVEPIYRELVSLLLQADTPQAIPQKNLLQARNVMEALQVAELVNFFRADCVVTSPVEIDQVDASALVIYPIILADRLEIVVSMPGRPLQHMTVPVPADQLNQILDRLRQSIAFPAVTNRSGAARAALALQVTTGASDHLPLAQQVYDWLIRPIEAQIESADVDVLVFVLDGALRNIPMGVLHDGDNYLIEKHAIALIPGLQLLEPRPLAERQVQALIAGLSEARDEFSALPNVAQEVAAIQTQVPGEVLLNERFSKGNFSGQLTGSPFPVVHLATHGQFSSDPEQTFVLAWDDRIRATELGALLQQGELTREAAIELLVLSACETAAGDERAALGLAGVAVRSGARSTLATLWLVDDRGTSVLMENFYRQLTATQQTKAEVLRQAQLALLQSEDYRHPYFWAPFVLVGNWL